MLPIEFVMIGSRNGPLGLCWIVSLLTLARIHSFAPSSRYRSIRCQLVRVAESEKDSEADDSEVDIDENSAWESSLALSDKPYVSSLFESQPEWKSLMESVQLSHENGGAGPLKDPLWEHVKLEASHALGPEPEAGPQLYQGILSKHSLIDAVVTVISHEIETELMPAPAIKNLFLEMLTPEDEYNIHLDVMAVAMRSPSVGNVMTATLFHRGFHALVCYRVGHRLWAKGRRGLSYYMQSTVSRKYSADIHPAAKMSGGIYLNSGGGVVIGETATVGQDVTILQGVTLGGTGKEAGNRHPKVGNGVILHVGSSVLGNIPVGDGAVIAAKSIVTKPVPPLARVCGVPAKIESYRTINEDEFQNDELEIHLGFKYMEEWQKFSDQTRLANATKTKP